MAIQNAINLTDAGVPNHDGDGVFTGVELSDGQLLSGVTGSTPVALNPYMQQGLGCWFWNLSFSYSSGVLTIESADGTALSSSNPAYVVMKKTVTGSELIQYKITANQTLTVSDMTGNTLGTTASIAWASEMPLYVGFMADNTYSNLTGFVSRTPNLIATPSSTTEIGDPSAANADEDYSVFAFDDITEADFVTVPVGYVGAVEVVKDSSDAWTIQALSGDTGIGNFCDKRLYTMPTGQNGAASGGFILDNGGTAPSFVYNEYNYSIATDGNVSCKVACSADAGTDGSGAVPTLIVCPLRRSDSYNTTFGLSAGSFTVTYAGTTTVHGQLLASSINPVRHFKFQISVSQALANGTFTNGNRGILANWHYMAYNGYN